MYARPFIDSLEFAENGTQLDAQVPVVELSRLHDALSDTQGELHCTVTGGRDRQGRAVLDLSVSGDCRLICQRCLGPLDYSIRHEVRLQLCDEAQLAALDSDDAEHEEEELDAILADAHLDVVALMEDEILLSLPISPMHDAGSCRVAESDAAQKGGNNPFAILENLKRN